MGLRLPARPKRNSGRAAIARECPAHRAFVRSFACSSCGEEPGNETNPIEAAHVRIGTDGGEGLKPTDCWCVSLCQDCHSRQHNAHGERTFWAKLHIDPHELAKEFARQSKPWQRHLMKGRS